MLVRFFQNFYHPTSGARCSEVMGSSLYLPALITVRHVVGIMKERGLLLRGIAKTSKGLARVAQPYDFEAKVNSTPISRSIDCSLEIQWIASNEANDCKRVISLASGSGFLSAASNLTIVLCSRAMRQERKEIGLPLFSF